MEKNFLSDETVTITHLLSFTFPPQTLTLMFKPRTVSVNKTKSSEMQTKSFNYKQNVDKVKSL